MTSRPHPVSRTTRTSGGGAAATRSGPTGTSGVAHTGSGDVYAGRDGNVYKRQDNGSWQQYDNGNGNWNSVQPTTAERDQAQQRANDARGQTQTQGTARQATPDASTVGQLNRDSAARSEGATRTRDASSSGTRAGAASTYRPSGGGARAGGGRRR